MFPFILLGFLCGYIVIPFMTGFMVAENTLSDQSDFMIKESYEDNERNT